MVEPVCLVALCSVECLAAPADQQDDEKKRYTRGLDWAEYPNSFWQSKVTYIDNKKYLAPRDDKEQLASPSSIQHPCWPGCVVILSCAELP